jgi:hypothetical protein
LSPLLASASSAELAGSNAIGPTRLSLSSKSNVLPAEQTAASRPGALVGMFGRLMRNRAKADAAIAHPTL